MRRSALLFWALAAPLAGATFTVTNTDDSGPGSLRQAILDANANAGLDTIAFNVPGAGVHTIAPVTNFANILEAVVIDGYTQPGTSVNTDPAGTNAVLLIELDGSAMAAGGIGFNITGAGASTVRGLVMNRWGTLAIQTAGAPVGAVITGNFLGTDPSGTQALGNATAISPTSSGTTIGGPTPADRNLISGNSFGVYVQEHGTVIRGNLIGTDATGMLPLGNTNSGILCANFGGTGTAIGGSGAGEGNVISGNLIGVGLSQGGGLNVVRGNRIGVNAAGTGPLGNSFGIQTTTGGDHNIIGGVGPGEPNEIAYNTVDGVRVEGGGFDDPTRGNSIHDNGGVGIALGGGAPHFNDPLDADEGPNHLQNFPIVREVEHLGPQGAGSTRIVGKLRSTPSTTFDLDFYSNPACSNFPREFVEGETWLGTSPVTTDGGGDAAFDVTLPVQTEAGARISVTATDPAGNTSEFSQRIVFSIFPTSGPETGSSGITVLGTDLADPTTVTVGGVAATDVAFVNDHQLTATMPALAPGTSNDVVVTTPDGTTGTLIKGWVADFLDVPQGHIFHNFVVTLVSNGITVGVGGGLYGVDQGTKRQQMAVFLLKAKYGLCYVPPQCTGTFPDVVCPSLFADWIEALAAEGITTGCGGGNFCPDNLVTRRQMAVFLLKSKYGSSYVPPACTGVFDDVACPGAPAVDFIERLAAEQITGGCSTMPPLYCPDNSSTRGQMAVFITKTFNLQ
jgi:hypothetical protein